MSSPKNPKVHEVPKPVDVRRALDEALVKLKPLGSDYVLIGGVALGIYGIERFTKDVDLAATKQVTAKAESSLVDCDPRPLRIGGVSIATSSGVRVDLIDHRFEYGDLFEEAIAEAKKRGELARTDHAEVPVVSLPYLVAMKLIADRPKDELDLKLLLEFEALDYRETRKVVEHFVGRYAAKRLDKLARAAARKDAPRDYDAGDK